jgi:tRNA A37 methylthiotransferase MiaB
VGGCLPGINNEKLKKYFNGETITTKDLENFDKIFEEKVSIKDVEDGNFTETEQGFEESFKKGLKNMIVNKIKKCYGFAKNLQKSLLAKKFYEKIFYLRIASGCLGNCSYCGIKNAIGRLKSKNIQDCSNEFRKGIKKGYKYFFIGGDDVGAYGLDQGKTFVDLLKLILDYKENFYLIIQDFHPKWLIKYWNDLELLFSDKRLVRFFCPLQSGSKRILIKMNRDASLNKLKIILKKIKKNNKNIELATCLIIGFPSETQKDFKRSLEFVKECGFDEVSLFQFSVRPHTEAFLMKSKISSRIIKKRLKKAKKFFKLNNIKVLTEIHDFFHFRPPLKKL